MSTSIHVGPKYRFTFSLSIRLFACNSLAALVVLSTQSQSRVNIISYADGNLSVLANWVLNDMLDKEFVSPVLASSDDEKTPLCLMSRPTCMINVRCTRKGSEA